MTEKKIIWRLVLTVILTGSCFLAGLLGAMTVWAGNSSSQEKKIFPAWFFPTHSSQDKELWGNRGIGAQGYFLGGPSGEARAENASTHTVVKGESLWRIAGYKNIYGDPTKWPLIYQANRDKIKNPDLIYPNQVLVIPR